MLRLKRISAWLLLVMIPSVLFGAEEGDSVPRRRNIFRAIVLAAIRFMEEFDHIDTTYIEPQAYNFATMLQNTNTYESYRFSTRDGNMSIKLSPDPSYRMGPYFGYRWAFLGYTFDVAHVFSGSARQNRTEWDFSLYSSMFGIDFFWRNMGNGYKIKDLKFNGDESVEMLKGSEYKGFSSSLRGVNVYYIFNHRKFSYPAAYSQSNVQRRSAGSALVGLGFTRHTMYLNLSDLVEMVRTPENSDELNHATDGVNLDLKYKYLDISASGGYSYNWVFARNCLFNASLSAAIGYKSTSSDIDGQSKYFTDFKLKNFNVDGVGRFAILYNNMRWFAGLSAILHTYQYDKDQISTSNINGVLNFYVGFNFGRRKR
ncbi:MAG: DUF4421 domain-containing protein [Prevotella sp.]|nr:DUF4421 domain-containing protein [Prevotella sp.]